MTLGDIIKAYREEHGLSMRDFARASGLTKGFISMLEHNMNPKTREPIKPSVRTIQMAAKGMFMDFNTLFEMISGDCMIDLTDNYTPLAKKSLRIPVLDHAPDDEAVEDALGYEEISDDIAHTGEIFALRINGDSMEPVIHNHSTVIVRQQDDAAHGDIIIVEIDGKETTCRRLMKYRDGIRLISENAAYRTLYYTNEELKDKPFQIIGKVIEARNKFE